MTDAQLVITIISALVSLGGGAWVALRWAVTQITKAINDSTAGQKEAAKEAATAHVEAAKETARAHLAAAAEVAKAQLAQAQAFATMAAKLDTVFGWVEHHTPVEMHRVPMPLPDPPSGESERRIRERYPDGYSAVPEPVEPHKGAPYHYTKKNRKT